MTTNKPAKSNRGRKRRPAKPPTLNKDGTPRKIRRNNIVSSTERIMKWFIVPFLKEFWFRPGTNELQEGIDFFFNADYRSVRACKSTSRLGFNVPGRVWNDEAGGFIIGFGDRLVKHGDVVFVREDVREEYVDVEHKEQVFRMKRTEYEAVVQEHLKFIA